MNQRAEPGTTNTKLWGWRSSARAPERKRTQGWSLSGTPWPGPAWLRTGATGTAKGHQRCYSEACRVLRCGAAPCPLLVDPGGALLRENAPHSPPLAVREHPGAAPRAHPCAPSPRVPRTVSQAAGPRGTRAWKNARRPRTRGQEPLLGGMV